MKNLLVLASLLLVVFLAGCTVGAKKPTAAGNGLIIKSFSPDFGEVRSGETITLSTMVENIGEADATGIAVDLFGLNLGGAEWNLLSGSDPQKLSILRKADPSLDLPGESHEFSWSLRTPQNLKVDNTYTADMRVYHKYSTSSASTLRFVTYDYLKSLPTDQFETVKATSGVTQSQVSGAPISLSMGVGKRPLIVYSDGDTFSLQIIVSNIGSGNAFNKTVNYPGYPSSTSVLSSDDLHYVYVDINPHGLDVDCSAVLVNTTGQPDKTKGYLRLTRGKSKTVFCTIAIPSVMDIGNTKDYSVGVELGYGYFVDSSTSIKVLKTD